jgi:hypothetical protein
MVMATITTRKAASRSGRRYLVSIRSLKLRHMDMKEARTDLAGTETPSQPVASRIAKISGAIRHQYLANGKMVRLSWAERS